jgi:signal transduction histidine kinase
VSSVETSRPPSAGPPREERRRAPRRVSWRRILLAGLSAAALIAAVGLLLERMRLGQGLEGAMARAEAEVRRDFDRMTSELAAVASSIASADATSRALVDAGVQGAGEDAARTLFDIVAARTQPNLAVTVYSMPSALARAWTGRPSDIPVERIRNPRAWFVAPSPQGLRLVHIVPVSADGQTVGVVAAERALSSSPAAASISRTEYLLSTRFGPVSLRADYEGAGEAARPSVFVLRSPDGEILVEATVSPESLVRARTAWRRQVAAAVLATMAVTLLLLVGPVLDGRSDARSAPAYRRWTVRALLLVLGVAVVVWSAVEVRTDGSPARGVLLLVCGGTLAAAVALLAAPLARIRASLRARRSRPSERPAVFVAWQMFAGILLAGALVIFAGVLRRSLEGADVDLQHFSLHPWSGPRLTLLAAILSSHLATLWGGTLICALSLASWRVSRRTGNPLVAIFLWTAPSLALAAASVVRGWTVPPLGLAMSALACALAAFLAPEVSRWFRHATVAARILALFGAFLLPSLLLYPSVNFFTDRAVRHVISTEYAVEAQNHPQSLQKRLEEARGEIDALPRLEDFFRETAAASGAAPRPDSAFFIWRQTALARYWLTSAVELYDSSGALLSRFPLDFPEYTGTIQTPKQTSCEWEVFGEATPFGAEERRVLHAERSVCTATSDGVKVLGSIVLHVVFDYRTLSFISSQSPYFEVFRTAGGAPPEGSPGSEVEIVTYGWGLTPLYASGGAAWLIDAELFDRIYSSRDPFWTRVDRGSTTWNVYFSNDRNGVYGIGYPTLTLFDRFVHLAELTTLAGAAYTLVLIVTAILTRVARQRPRVGRALLREIRASFYRKLFLAFVLASVIPVVALALVIRVYFETLLRADVEAQAVRAASVAQGVIEESDALQRRGGEGLPSDSDDVMIWISQVIDQDVNVFEGADLLASSEQALFASGLLPTRTPDTVYRAIVLERLPSFVGEDRIGDFPYMIAATPVRAGDRDLVLTVPLATQQREIEREVDELDRGVHLAALFFILLGSGMGLSMAERIADPVRRLTRATRRIASGDFDARIAVKSADELRRLVDAFNSMAGELKAQRAQLERTHRLEAWAEMARQVAHEIKNPLTPIQLSAEHLRRVHADRGQPMGPVLESCVTSILGQVRLLRQISSEFSNFASSPIARPAAVDLPELVAEVVDPYRTGLEGRIRLDNQVRGPLPFVFVDRTLIGRALANIVENALHAMPARGALTLTAAVHGGAVVVRIRDTGAGMDEESLARVFEPYFSTKATGTGLGLPIARRNVELSGGRIEVESARGEGTMVILTLPVAV